MPPTWSQRWAGRRLVAASLLILVACSPPVVIGPTPSAGSSSGPQPTDEQASQPPDAPAVASRQDLIAKALAEGRIDLVTSLVDRAYARFGMPQLPAEFAGAPSRGDDAALFAEIVDLIPTLPEADQQRLKAFVVRPTEPGSVFSADFAGARARIFSAAIADASPTAPPIECRDWTDSGAASAHFKVWACTDGDPTSAAADVATVAALLDELWGPMTKPEPTGMGPPIPDGSGANVSREYGGDARIDVYELKAGEGVYRGGLTGVPGDALAAAVPSPPYFDATGNAVKTSSGFILVDRARIPARDDMRRDLIHEFFHVLQNAHNHVGPTRGKELHWFEDASATWAETYYFRPGSPSVHTWFSSRFQLSQVGLEAQGGPQPVDADHPYAAYIWPFFMEQEVGASAVFKAWVGIEAAEAGDFEAVSKAINTELPFDKHFRDFGVRNLNRQLEPSEPHQVHYVDLDKAFPDGQPVPINAGEIAKSRRLDSGPVSIEPLAATYTYLTVDPDARDVTIDLRDLASQKDLDGDVLLHIDGAWKRRPVDGGLLHLCRDLPAENFDQMYLVLSNHGRDAPIKGAFTIVPRAGCGDLVGTISWTTTSRADFNNGEKNVSSDTVSVAIRANTEDGEWVDDGSTYSWSGSGKATGVPDAECGVYTQTTSTVGAGQFLSDAEELSISVDRGTNTVGVIAVVSGELFTHITSYHMEGPDAGHCVTKDEDSTQGGAEDRAGWVQQPRCHNDDEGVSGKISTDGRTVDLSCTSTETHDLSGNGTDVTTFTVSGTLTFNQAPPH